MSKLFPKCSRLGGRLALSVLALLSVLIGVGGRCTPEEEQYLDPVNVSGDSANVCYAGYEPPSIAIDRRGTLHLVWTDNYQGRDQVLYASKPKDGDWSQPANASNTPASARFRSIAVDRNDAVHLAWQQWISDTAAGYWGWAIFYSCKSLNGSWSAPETVYWNLMSSCPSLCVDDAGNVHLLWLSYIDRDFLTYALRSPDGTWSTPAVVFTPPSGIDRDFYPEADRHNGLHLLFSTWHEPPADSAALWYLQRSATGEWSAPTKVFTLPPPSYDIWSPTMAIDDNDVIHASWISEVFEESTQFKANFYAERPLDGEWSSPVPLIFRDSTYRPPRFSVLMGNAAGLHLLWYDHESFAYSRKDANEDWSKPIPIRVRGLATNTMRSVTDVQDRVHVAWVQYMGFEVPNELYYVMFEP